MRGRSAGAPEVVGREAERAWLLAVLADVRQGRSRAVVVRGEAGIGKTILLEDLTRAAGALTVLRADGMRTDVDLPWSGLRQLLDPLLDAIGALPDPQAAALGGALGLAGAHPGTADRFAVGAAALALLAAAAERAAVLAVVDDFQWLDRESADALAFAAGRLEAESVGLLIGFRDGEEMRPEPPVVEELALEPLDDGAAAALLARATPSDLAPDVARRVLAAAAGNPLAIVELPGILTADQRAGRRPFDEPLPAASSVRDVFARRLSTLTEAARGALAVAAAHLGDDAEVVDAALARCGFAKDALAPSENADLVERREGRVRFRHPLARAAVRDVSSAPEWRRAHAALADVFADRGDRESRARHLVAATEHPDEYVAAMLEEAAIDARRRGALTTAAYLATHAARLTPDQATGARRRLAAAEAALLGGSLTTVPALLDEIDDADADERTRARAAHLRGRHLVLAGRPRKAMFILRDGAAAIERVDPTAAALMLIEGSAAANHSGDVDVSIEMAQRACELTLEASPEGTLATVALGAALVASGRRSEGHDLLIRYPELLSQPDLLATAVPMLMAVASGLVWLEQFDDAIELLDPFIALARRSGAVGTLPLALALKGWAHQRISQTTAAEAALVESLQLADETGQHTIALQARATLAALYNGLLRGAELRAHTSVVRRSTSPGSGGARTGTTMALGGLLLAENRLDEAVELLTEIADPSDPGATLDNSTHHAAFVNLADAYLRLGRREDAARVAELLGRTGRERGIDWTLGHAERLAGLLAPTTPSTRTSRRRAGCCGAFRLCGWPSSVRGGSGCALPAATTRLGFTSTPRCARRAPPGSGGGPTGPSPSCGRWGRTWPRSTRPPPLL